MRGTHYEQTVSGGAPRAHVTSSGGFTTPRAIGEQRRKGGCTCGVHYEQTVSGAERGCACAGYTTSKQSAAPEAGSCQKAGKDKTFTVRPKDVLVNGSSATGERGQRQPL